MNKDTKQINLKHFDVPRPVILNYEEFVMRQTEDGALEVHSDVQVHDAINGINIIQLIDQNNVDMLYEMDRKGQYRPLNTALHKLFNSLERPSVLKERFEIPELEVFDEAIKIYIPTHMLTALEEPIFWKMDQSAPITSRRVGMVKANFLNNLVRGIFELTQQPAYKQALQNRLERSQNQYQKGMKLINELFDLRCKLLIIREDFALKAETNLSLTDLKTLMSKFLKKILVNKGELEGIEGYIWKLEYGVQKGYHYHCIFFMDGSKHIKDSYYAQKLGELWKQVTDDQGIFHNCNASKFKYRNLAIGCISHDDEEARKNLEIVMSYLSKTDQFLMEKTLKKYRVFGTSTRKIEKSQSGRPRDNLKN
ncbi:TPA: inovirus-type Gp2 protein [Acinetobacter baumannii]|uniref:inovirus-type Gp2 protein n=1 Tax=Acinetobacter calcoaceticus/baumannii complex TaxID=909768 RepID=UPI0007501D8B|nr:MULTISPECIES: inovirus-type Gp2 protein [Acinetobacter calcoaceticus/baumannii complex]EKW1221791.1 inovirus-type Gp2 protein [Acinetobacter baumannii]ELB0337855.1 inovirus-type Gp2 protein [Acinetobacter baumannii]ELN4151902.1 inovirus-type Gp2 protein [Acinetobacter baumannii]MDA3552776.1 inovirus Gp2 family protein [Acinetobacter baumannii]PHM79734.1 inovirus Gp2 family protein [Acinetobacter nosocomialis]